MTTMTIAKAINEGLRATLSNNPKTLLMGEDIGPLGGVYRVTDGLIGEFGADRVVDTPLAESGIVGTAIGLALRGYLPVCEIQFDGFVFPGFNQITTQLAKMHSRSNGNLTVPVVIRIPYGGGIGSIEHHSESPEALFAHTAGLRIITPSNPHDAYWMIQQAVDCQDPVIVFEPKRRYWLKGEVDTETAGLAEDPFKAHVVREGTRCHRGGLRAPRSRGPRGGECRRGRRAQHRSHRPPLHLADRLRHHRSVGKEDRPAHRVP